MIERDQNRQPLAIELVGFLVVVLMVVLFYYPLLIPGHIQAGGDAANLFWPVKDYIYSVGWGSGSVALWNHYSFLGSPLAASLQHGVFYPPDWLVYLVFPASYGLGVSVVLHLLILAAGIYYGILRLTDWSITVSVFVTVSYTCCAWFWGHMEHINQIAASAWLPWLLYFLIRAIATAGSSGYWCGFVAVGSIQLLAGHPQEVFYSHLAIVVSGLLYYIWQRPPFKSIQGMVLKYGLGVALMVGIAAVQLLPTLELSNESIRQFDTDSYSSSFSLPPEYLQGFVIAQPYGNYRDVYFHKDSSGEYAAAPLFDLHADTRAHGEFGLFIGYPVLLFALIAVFLLFKSRQRVNSFFVFYFSFGFLFFIVYALGNNAAIAGTSSISFSDDPNIGISLHCVVELIFPFADGFRAPSRALMVALLFLALLSGEGLNYVEKNLFESHWPVTLALVVSYPHLYYESLGERFRFPVPTTDAKSLIQLEESSSAELKGRMFRLALNDDARLMAERMEYQSPEPELSIMARLQSYQPHMNVLLRQPILDGYEEGLLPSARHKAFLMYFNRNLRQFTPDPYLLTLMGVETIYTEAPIDQNAYKFEDFVTPESATFKNPFYTGLAFPQSLLTDEAISVLNSVSEDSPSRFMRNDKAVILGDELPYLGSFDDPFSVSVRGPNTIEVRAPESFRSNAVLSIAQSDGWVINGNEPATWITPIHVSLRAELASEADGGLVWQLSYQPFTYRIGFLVSSFSLMVLFCLGSLAFTRKRKQSLQLSASP